MRSCYRCGFFLFFHTAAGAFFWFASAGSHYFVGCHASPVFGTVSCVFSEVRLNLQSSSLGEERSAVMSNSVSYLPPFSYACPPEPTSAYFFFVSSRTVP
jgi:hypothetical protein